MRPDAEQLRALGALEDDALWKKVVELAAQKGLKLGAATPTHEDLERLRRMLRASESIRIGDAMRLVNEYKRKYGK